MTRDDEVTITYQRQLRWTTEDGEWTAWAGTRKVANIIRSHTGGMKTDWFEDSSGDCDNSTHGEVPYLKAYIQRRWNEYLEKLAAGGSR